MTRQHIGQTESPACNSGFKKLAVQWLNQVQFFNQTDKNKKQTRTDNALNRQPTPRDLFFSQRTNF